MNHKIRFAAALALALLVPAASAAGQSASVPSAELMFTVGYVQSNLVKGKTRRADVIEAFGNPMHQKVRATESGSTEVLYYKKGAQQQASKGGGVAKTTRSIGAIAGGLSRMLGSQAAQISNQADNLADGMETIAGSGGSGNAQPPSSGPSTITVELQNGLVSSYSLE